jgi:hypothetical protein
VSKPKVRREWLKEAIGFLPSKGDSLRFCDDGIAAIVLILRDSVYWIAGRLSHQYEGRQPSGFCDTIEQAQAAAEAALRAEGYEFEEEGM